MGCDINDSRRGFESHKMSNGWKSRAGGKRAGQNATADPVIPDHLKGCLSAAFSRAVEIVWRTNWDGLRASEDRTRTLCVKIDQNCWSSACEWIEARGGSDEGAGERLVIFSRDDPLNHPHLAEQLGGRGWEELGIAITAQGGGRISTVAIDRKCRVLTLTLQFTHAGRDGQGISRRAGAALGRDLPSCGVRNSGGAGGSPRRIGL